MWKAVQYELYNIPTYVHIYIYTYIYADICGKQYSMSSVSSRDRIWAVC